MSLFFKQLIFPLLFCLLFFISIFPQADAAIAKSSAFSGSDLGLKYNNNLYKSWIKYFTVRERELFQDHLKNGERYYSLIRNIFVEYGLPKDLYYVGLIESGYKLRIKSRASAVGPWQFIKATGRRYGLRVGRGFDERMDIDKSTHAAAKYLKDLYEMFGSWELALCAYNKGENGMLRAIRRGKSRDYQVLARKRLIPRETAQYISKIAAARELVNNKRKYRFAFNFRMDR